MMRQRTSALWCVAVVGLVVGLGYSSPVLADDATGTWKWTAQRGETTIEQTLKLKQDGEKLTGTISGRQDTETEIEDGKVDGDTISFTVTREFNGNRIVIMYEGKVEDDTIKGEWKVERGGETLTRPWEAKRAESDE